MLKLGNQNIAALRLGGTEIKKAYLGGAVVFNVSEPPVPTYTISASIDPAGSGTVSGAGTYQAGETVTVTAVPEEGYQFTGWQENGVVVSKDAAYTFMVAGDRVLAAVFEAVAAGRLPEGYTEVEYISPLNNNSKISTGLPLLTTGGSIEMDVEVTVSTVGSYTWYPFICYRSASSKYYGAGVFLLSTNEVYFQYFYGVTSLTGTVYSSNVVRPTFPTSLNIKFNQSEQTSTTKYIWINGTRYSKTDYFSVYSSTAAYVYIGGGNIATPISYARDEGALRVKSVIINGHELVPCIDPTGTVGLYDLAANKFKGPSGTTYLWAAGPAV